MKTVLTFEEVFTRFVERDDRTPGQLFRKSAELFGVNQSIPKPTIVRWLNGEVKKTRSWHDLVKIAIVLRLSKPETDELLQAAGQPSIIDLQEKTKDEREEKLLSHWDKVALPLPYTDKPFQVRQDLPDFTGRATELHTLRVMLQTEKRGQVCCLIGMGGVGKTSLAIHVACQLQSYFQDGVLWAQLDKTDSMTVLQTFAEAYGYDVTGYADLNSRSSRVRELLARKRALIILDNAERDEELRPLLPPKGLCSVLITTRHHDLSTTDAAYRLYLQPFSEENGESLALFRQILGEKLAGQERLEWLEIANLLGHLPLALSVVAYRRKNELGWSAADFLTRLRQAEKRLGEIQRGDLNLLLSFDLSYQSLPADAQRFFVILTVFEGEDFDLPAIAYVADTPMEKAKDNIRLLYNLCFIQPGRKERYQLHPLVRDYGRQKLTHTEPILRMVRYFVEYAKTHTTAYDSLDVEISNLLAALRQAATQKMYPELLEGVIELYLFLKARGLYETANTYLNQAEQVARDTQNTNSLIVILSHLGHLAGKQGQNPQAGTYYLEALELVNQQPEDQLNPVQVSTLLTRLGALAHRQGQFDQAQSYYRQALTLAEKTGDLSRVAACHNNLGILAFVQGNYPQAKQYYQQAIAQARQLQDFKRLFSVLQNMGFMQESLGDYATAKTYFSEGFEIASQLKDPELLSRVLSNLGLVAYALENHAEAAAHFRKGLSLAEKIQHMQLMSQHHAYLGQTETKRNHYGVANKQYQEALDLARSGNFTEEICSALNGWGESLLVQGNEQQATNLLIEASQLAQSYHLPHQLAKSWYGLAKITAMRGNLVEAKQLGEKSQTVFADLGHKRASEVEYWLKELPEEINIR